MVDRVNPPPITQHLQQRSGTPSLAWSKWFDQVFRAANNFKGVAFQAASVTFEGQAGAGSVPIVRSYNTSSLSRSSTGVYVATVSQSTAYGITLLDDNITAMATVNSTSSPYQIHVEPTTETTFTINIYLLQQGAGSVIDKVLADPIGDEVTINVLSRLSDELAVP